MRLIRLPGAAVLLSLFLVTLALPVRAAFAEGTTPTVEQRLANLEAYVTNVAPDAQGGALASTSGPGHNGWVMVCAALVLLMTLPGLALFYGGLVRRKNVLSVIAQCFGCAGLVTVMWWLVGYSLAFDSGTPILGGLDFAMFSGVTAAPNGNYAAWVSQNVFSMFQLMFAIITPAR